MQKVYSTAIIGGGAAGLMSAVELLSGENKLRGSDVVIIERTDRVGKKLVATGNGQGNLMNARFGAQYYYGNKDFISAFVAHANAINIEKYLYGLGIPLITSKDGKMYPVSKQASAVLDVIRAKLSYEGVEEMTGEEVLTVEKSSDVFKVKTTNKTIFAKSVVMATGGSAAKQFGTDGTAYAIAEKFGHNRTKLFPSLVQLKTELDKIRGLKGLKEVAKVTAIVDGKNVKSATGDLLFTEYGVSGSSVFSVSAAVSDKQNVILNIEFMPDYTQTEVEEMLNNRLSLGFIKKEDCLSGLLLKRVGQSVLKTAKTLSPKDVAWAVKNFKLKVTGNLGFNYAQVTKGGIVVGDVLKETYESKLCKDFYIVGEALDVDGDCGGYNLTFAFTSGIIAAKTIKKREI